MKRATTFEPANSPSPRSGSQLAKSFPKPSASSAPQGCNPQQGQETAFAGGRLLRKAIRMTPANVVLYTVLFGLGYLVAPAMLVWGWVRWIKHRPRLWTITSALSFIGFLLATASALYGLWMIFFAEAGGFLTTYPNYSPDYGLLYKFIRRGALLSLLGTLFAIGGIWRRGPVRWQAPASAVGTLAFWLLATTWP